MGSLVRRRVSLVFLLCLAVTLSAGCAAKGGDRVRPVEHPRPAPDSGLDPARVPGAQADREDARVGEGVHAWPIYLVEPENGGTRTEVLWPLFSMLRGADGDVWEWDALVPLVSYAGGPTRRTLAVRPLFDVTRTRQEPDGPWTGRETDVLWPIFHHERNTHGTQFDVRPLLFSADHEDHEYLAIVPVWFQGSYANAEWTVVFPFWWKGRSGDRTYRHLWPVYGVTEEDTWRRETVAWPTWVHTEDPATNLREWDLFKPMFHYGRSDEGTTVRAVPLLWHRLGPDTRSTVVFPVWWDFEDEDGRFFMVAPIWGEQTREDYRRTFVGGPLWVTTQDAERREWSALWPLTHWGLEGDDWDAHAFPFVWLERSDDRDLTRVWPLFGHELTDTREHWGVLEPFFQVTRGEGWTRVRAPWPLVESWSNDEGHSRTRVFPLFKHSETDVGSDWWVLGPTAFGHDRGDGDREFRLLWKLVEIAERGDRTVTAVNPFWHHEENADGDSATSWLLGLWKRVEEDGDVRHRVLWVLDF